MRKLLVVATILALVVGIGGRLTTAPARAAGIAGPYRFYSVASSGTFGPFDPKGGSLCPITFTSGGGAAITVLGAADGLSTGTYVTNTNYGTSGVITAPSSNSIVAADTSHYPTGLKMTFTGNTGVLSGSVTCSGLVGSVGGLSGSPCITIVNGVVTYVCATPAPQITPVPASTAVPTAGPPADTWSGTYGANAYTDTLSWYQQPSLYGSSGNSSATTATANTYVEITAVSGTTPAYSPGHNGNWFLEIDASVFLSAVATNGIYVCLVQTGTALSTVNQDRGAGATNCVTTLAGSIGGAPLFGTSAAFLGPVHIRAYQTIAVNTPYNVQLWVATPVTSVNTAFGYPILKWTPN